MSGLRIFISSTEEDDALSSLIGALLAAQGCDVWRHENRAKTAAYRAATLSALNDADIVLVLWSQASTSPWVIDEADAGMKSGKAVTVEIGHARFPLGFAVASRARIGQVGDTLTAEQSREIWDAIVEAAEQRQLLGNRRLSDRTARPRCAGCERRGAAANGDRLMPRRSRGFLSFQHKRRSYSHRLGGLVALSSLGFRHFERPSTSMNRGFGWIISAYLTRERTSGVSPESRGAARRRHRSGSIVRSFPSCSPELCA